ncbi:MAG: hypothetical protein HDQ92_01290 [Desulfovibrio sp.]|nr:hypothetical protein [Desulfovibrio sp.]
METGYSTQQKRPGTPGRGFANMAPEGGRTLRLLHIMREIRSIPAQSLETVLQTFGISRSQFYKDKDALASLGFRFEYRKGSGFRITEDRLTPLQDLSLSDRVILLFALGYLSTSTDGLLAAKAIEVGRKLAYGLESPFREQLLSCLDHEVTETAYGVQPEIFQALTVAIGEGRRIRMRHFHSWTWTESRREVPRRHLCLRQRTLYLYARTVDEQPPAWSPSPTRRTGKRLRPNVHSLAFEVTHGTHGNACKQVGGFQGKRLHQPAYRQVRQAHEPVFQGWAGKGEPAPQRP